MNNRFGATISNYNPDCHRRVFWILEFKMRCHAQYLRDGNSNLTDQVSFNGLHTAEAASIKNKNEYFGK